MKSFTNFYEMAGDIPQPQKKRVSDDAVTIFGRHNPPHLGHGATFDKASKIASSIGDKAPADQSFYTSRSQDPKKNPLPFEMKLDFLKKMFPKHAGKWDDDRNVKTILGAATKAHDKGYKNFHFVGGDDRRQGMEDLLRRYNGQLYDFENIYSHSAGERDPNSEDPIAKLSASGQRSSALNDNFEKFLEGVGTSKTFKMEDAKQLFGYLQKFMQKNESWMVDHKTHSEFISELYRTNELYKVGDIIEHDVSGLCGEVTRCGANHLICVTEDGIMFKTFIQDANLL